MRKIVHEMTYNVSDGTLNNYVPILLIIGIIHILELYLLLVLFYTVVRKCRKQTMMF